MKKTRGIFTCLAILAALLLAIGAQAEAAEEGPAEWTVLFYLCGSDLESRYGYASDNLRELQAAYYPNVMLDSHMEIYGLTPTEEQKKQPGRVNVLIETGGSSEWHAQDIGLDIDPTALQRWSFNTYGTPQMIAEEEAYTDGFQLMETLPLQSMADPETLADFISWGVETMPAKKYALVLWDHGDGARTGLFIDELFDQDILYLFELKQALEDGGTHFEAVIIDACLMANLETVWNIQDSANWLVASEETVPGKGTAIGDWMQQLLCYPECDGEWLGRCVCDTTSIKYGNEGEKQFKDLLTWSVIDLNKAEALEEALESFFQEMILTFRKFPFEITLYMNAFNEAPEYGDGNQRMRDLGSILYNQSLWQFTSHTVRSRAIQALSEAVAYCVRGEGRSEARGLTICYPADYTEEQLDIYAMNCPMLSYLALVDSITEWEAPAWVFGDMERLPEIDENEKMRVFKRQGMCQDGMPGVLLDARDPAVVQEVYYTLYRLNEETGQTLRLGRTNCVTEEWQGNRFETIWRAADPMHWPAVEGELMCMDLIQVDEVKAMKLYNVPVTMDSRTGHLRLSRHVNYAEDAEEKINEYQVYGLWDGYEENSVLMNRSVLPLSALVGREYQLLYPIEDTALFEMSAPLNMYRSLDVEEIPLPAGTYYLEYNLVDVFLRRTVLGRIEIQWDGERMTLPAGDAWEEEEWTDLRELREAEQR